MASFDQTTSQNTVLKTPPGDESEDPTLPQDVQDVADESAPHIGEEQPHVESSVQSQNRYLFQPMTSKSADETEVKVVSSEEGEASRSTRPKELMETGREYQIDLRRKALQDSKRKWVKVAETVQDALADCFDIQQLQTKRDALTSCMEELENGYDRLSEIESPVQDIETFIKETQNLRQHLNSKIGSLRMESKSTISYKGSHHSSSSGSSRSSKSMRLNEKMKMAELETRLKWADREACAAKQKA